MPILPFATLGSLSRSLSKPADDYDPLAEIDAIIGVNRRTRVATPEPAPPKRTTIATPKPKITEPAAPTLIDPLADILSALDEPAPAPEPLRVQGRALIPDTQLPTRRPDDVLPLEAPKPPASRPLTLGGLTMKPVPAHEKGKPSKPEIPSLLPGRMPKGQAPIPGFDEPGLMTGHVPERAKRPEEIAADEWMANEAPTSGPTRGRDYLISAIKGVIGVPEAAVGIADIVLANSPVGSLARERGLSVGKIAETAGFDPKTWKAVLDTFYSKAQQEANARVQASGDAVEGQGWGAKATRALAIAAESIKNPSVIAHNVVESLPSMVAGGVAGGMAGVAPALGGAIGEGLVQAGQSAEQMRQENPGGTLITPTQAALAVASGAGDTVIGYFGGKLAEKLGIADVDTMLAAGAADPVAGKTLAQQTRAFLGGMVQEGLLEELPQSLQEQVAQNLGEGKPWDNGIENAAIMGALAGAVMGGGAQFVPGGEAAQEQPEAQGPPSVQAPPTQSPVAARPGDTQSVGPGTPSPVPPPVDQVVAPAPVSGRPAPAAPTGRAALIDEHEALLDGGAGVHDPLRKAIEAATMAKDIDETREALKWAQANGRPDITAVILERVNKQAENAASAKPGVSESNPKYASIVADLAARAEESKRDAEQLTRLATLHAPLSDHPVIAAIEETLAVPPELGPDAYAGPERRSSARVSTPDKDAEYARMRAKIAAGEPTGTEEAKADFAERQRVEEVRRQAAVDEVESMGEKPKPSTLSEEQLRSEIRGLMGDEHGRPSGPRPGAIEAQHGPEGVARLNALQDELAARTKRKEPAKPVEDMTDEEFAQSILEELQAEQQGKSAAPEVTRPSGPTKETVDTATRPDLKNLPEGWSPATSDYPPMPSEHIAAAAREKLADEIAGYRELSQKDLEKQSDAAQRIVTRWKKFGAPSADEIVRADELASEIVRRRQERDAKKAAKSKPAKSQPIAEPEEITSSGGMNIGDTVRFKAGNKWTEGQITSFVTVNGGKVRARVKFANDRKGESENMGAFVETHRDLSDLSPVKGEAPASAPKSKPAKSQPAAKTKSDWTEIGKNAIGQTLYEDQRGIRSYLENGVRNTESVQLRPTRAGMEFSTDRTGDKAKTWEVVEPHPATAVSRPAKSQPTKPIPPEHERAMDSLTNDEWARLNVLQQKERDGEELDEDETAEQDNLEDRVAKAMGLTDEVKEALSPDEYERMPPEKILPAPKATIQAKKLAGDELLDQESANAVIAGWKAEAKRIGKEEDHSNEVVISLFDRTGGWSQPYKDAGYDVRTFDIQNFQDILEDFPIVEIGEIKAAGKTIVGVLAAPPCTSYAVSGARWWKDQHDKADQKMVEKKYGYSASTFFDTPLDYANTLVAATQVVLELANPTQFHVMENPVGRIAEQNNLPKPLLTFDPSNFGDPYTKKTLLWGSFNPNLPTANVEPTKGSFMHTLRGDNPEQKAQRSITPEGFAYAFFMANHGAAATVAQSQPEKKLPINRDERWRAIRLKASQLGTDISQLDTIEQAAKHIADAADMATKGDGTVFEVGDRVRFSDDKDHETYIVKGIHPNGIRVEHEGEPGVGKAVSPANLERAPAEDKKPSPEQNVGTRYGKKVTHVTTPAGAEGIEREGFDIKRGNGLGGDTYGPGVYLADTASDVASFWRQQLETKNETGRVDTAVLHGSVSLERALVVEDMKPAGGRNGQGLMRPKDRREIVAAQVPTHLKRFDALVAEGRSANEALGQVAREAGFDGIVFERRAGEEIVAFDASTVTFDPRKGSSPEQKESSVEELGVARAEARKALERTGTAHRNGVSVKLVRADANAPYRVEVVRDGNRDYATGTHAHQADAIESAVNALFYEPPVSKPAVSQPVAGKADPVVAHNAERNSIEIKFPKKPSQEVLDKLKANGFRWAKGNKHWYHSNPARLTSEKGTPEYVLAYAMAKARSFVGLPVDAAALPQTGFSAPKAPVASKPAVSQPTKPKEPYTGERYAVGDEVEVREPMDGKWYKTVVTKPTDDEGRTQVTHPTLRMQGIVPGAGPGGKALAIGAQHTVPMWTKAEDVRPVAKASAAEAASLRKRLTSLTTILKQKLTANQAKGIREDIREIEASLMAVDGLPDGYVLLDSGQKNQPSPDAAAITGKSRPAVSQPIKPTTEAKLDAIADERAKLEAQNREAIARMQKRLANRLRMNIDPEDVMDAAIIVRNYVRMGILDFKAAAIRFQADFGDKARFLDRAVELAWRRLHPGQDLKVADVLPITVTPHELTGDAAAVQAKAIAALEQDPAKFKHEYAALKDGGRVLNADTASELFEDYAKSEEARATMGVAVRAPAGALIEAIFTDLLAAEPSTKEPVVVFTAGGNASGKSTGVADEKSADLIFDSTFSSLAPSKAKVDQALAAGRNVRIRYTYRDPMAAFQSALTRAMGEANGRTVTVRGLAATTIGARDTVLALAKDYADNPRVTFAIRENTGAKPVPRDLAWLQERAYNERRELEARLFDALEAARDADDITEAVYVGTRGIGRRPAEDRPGDGRRLREERGKEQADSGREATDAEVPEEVEAADGERDLSGRRPAGTSDDDAAGGVGDESAGGLVADAQRPEGASGEPRTGGKRRPSVRVRRPTRGSRVSGTGAEPAGSGGVHATGDVESPVVSDDVDVATSRGQAPLHFTINTAAELTDTSWTAKLDANMAALRLLKLLQQESRKATADEQHILAKYIGWGHTNLAPVVDPLADRVLARDPRVQQARQELEQILTKKELAELHESTANAHYSFSDLPRAMWDAVQRLGFKGGTILEPAVGTGHFFGTMPGEILANKRTRLFGVDKEPIAAAIAAQLYQGAHIQNSPLQDAVLPDNYFDLAISNVPFGRIKIFDPAFVSGDRDQMTRSIHNYYFAKALDVVRPGGLVVFITSRYTMDAQNDGVRQYIAGRAKLLGAMRLPDTSFKGTAGTEVVTDVIILQRYTKAEQLEADQQREYAKEYDAAKPADRKNMTPPVRPGWIESKEREVKGRNEWEKPTYHVNEYFHRHKSLILGQEDSSGKLARTNEPQYNVVGEAPLKVITKALDRMNLPEDAYSPSLAPPRKIALEKPADGKQGSFVVEKGKLFLYDKGTLTPSDLKGKSLERAMAFIPLRDAYQKVLDVMTSIGSDADLEAAQAQMRQTYDAFVDAHGYVSLPQNARIIELDPNGSRVLALEETDISKEKVNGRTVTTITVTGPRRPNPDAPSEGGAAIFSKRTVRPVKEPTSADTPRDAFVQSMAWKGQVDLPYMAKLTGQTEAELIQALKGEMYREPTTQAWISKDEYLSGDVVTKLASADAAAKSDDAYTENVEALRAVQPTPLGADEFDAPLGATWVPIALYEQFLKDEGKSESLTARVINNEHRTTFYVTGYGQHEFLPAGEDFAKWAEAALNGKLPTIKVRNSDGSETVDPKATEEYRQSLGQLREAWQTWWRSKVEVSDSLAAIYNAMFNREAARAFDGSHLVLPNASPDIQLRPWQKNVIWRAIQAGNTLLAHAVGAGKTYAMIGISGEMKRLGFAQKPMIVVPNHLVEQWRRDYLKMYPDAKVLVPSKRDFEKKHRQRLIARIANNDWDAVILAQTQFLRISVKPETLQQFVDEQIAMLVADGAEQLGMSAEQFEETVNDYEDGDKDAKRAIAGRGVPRSVKDIARMIMNLRARLQKRLDQQKKDAPIVFEQSGVDALLVDEAHLFKNLFFSTSRNNIAGLRGSDAQRSQDMFLKIRMINQQSGGRNVHFATGTPVSNAMSELYTMFRYLAQPTLERLGMAGFDSWANGYAVARGEMEPTADGGYKERVRLRDWSNLRELSKLFRRFADVILTSDLIKSGVLKLPKLKGGRPTTISVEPHPDMPAFMADIAARVEALKSGNVDPKDDNHLKISSEASLAAIDMRLVRPRAEDYAGSRLRVAAKEIAKRYHASADVLGAQVAFLDVGTPKAKALAGLPGLTSATKVVESQEEDEPDEAAGDIVDEQAEAEEAMEYIRGLGSDRDLYSELKRLLVEQGIPEHEIAFIHQAKEPSEQGKLFQMVIDGKVRVLLASTAKGGVGMNIQKRLVALHHLDVPWRPADIEQREGRILRQGNENPEVEILRYVTRGSFDEYRWGLLATKQGFIYQFMRGELTTMDDADPSQLDMQVAQALASGDPNVMKMLNLEREVKGLRARYTNYERKRGQLRSDLKWSESAKAIAEGRIAALTPIETEAKAWEEAPTVTLTKQPSGYGMLVDRKVPPFDWKDTESRKAFQAAIVEMLPKVKYEDDIEIGHAGPFKIFISQVQSEIRVEGGRLSATNVPVITVKVPAVGLKHPIVMGSSKPFEDPEHPPDYRRSLDHLLDPEVISRLIRENKANVLAREREAREASETLDKPFKQLDELKEKETELHALKLTVSGKKIDAAEEAKKKDEDTDGDEGWTSPHRPDDGGNISKAVSQPPVSRPIGGTPAMTADMKPSAIVDALSEALSVPVGVGRFRQKALGIHKQREQIVRSKLANDLPVILHEFGHEIGLNVLKINPKHKGWAQELLALGTPMSEPDATQSDVLREGEAEFLRLFLMDPAKAQADAPNYFDAFEAALKDHPDLAALLETTGENVRGYYAQDPATRGEARIDFDSQPIKPGSLKHAVADPKEWLVRQEANWVDDLAGLRRAVEWMDGAGAPVAEDDHAYLLARLARGAHGKAMGFLHHGVRDTTGHFTNGSLEAALKPVKGKYVEFARYLVARHVPEVIALGKAAALSEDEAAAIVRRYDSPEFQEAAKAVHGYLDAMLGYAYQGNAVSQDGIRAMKDAYEEYVPLKRVMDAVADRAFGGKGLANQSSPIKRRKGSGRDIINPLESIVKDTFAVVEMVEKNRAMLALVDQATETQGAGRFIERVPTPLIGTLFNLEQVEEVIRQELDAAGVDLPDNLDFDAFAKIFTPAQFVSPKGNVITVMRDGTREFYFVHDEELAAAIKEVGPQVAQLIHGLFYRPTSWLRAGATLTLGFVARNPIRDTFVAAVQSRYGFVPVLDTVRGLFSYLKADEYYEQFLNSGAANAALVSGDRDALRRELKTFEKGGKWASVPKNPIELLRALSEATENATRLGEFRRALQTEMATDSTTLEAPGARALAAAGLAARDVSLDFARGGRHSKVANNLYAFFNARVQGWARMGSMAMADAERMRKGDKNPMHYATGRAAAYITTFSILLWALNHGDGDDKDKDEYQKLPDWEKNTYWHIPLGGGRGFIRVPKPFEYGVIFGNTAEAALSFLREKDPAAIDRLIPAGLSLRQSALTLAPTVALPVVEAGANYDYFRGRPIISPYDTDLPLELQASRWTSSVSRTLGPKMGIAPAKLDHLIFGYFAGLGRGVVTAPEMVGRLTGTSNAPALTASDLPGVGTFYRRPERTGQSANIQALYDLSDTIAGLSRGVKVYEKSGQPEKGRTLAREHARELRAKHAIDMAVTDLRELRPQINKIYASQTMTPEQKRAALDRMYERMDGIAKRALQRAR